MPKKKNKSNSSNTSGINADANNEEMSYLSINTENFSIMGC